MSSRRLVVCFSCAAVIAVVLLAVAWQVPWMDGGVDLHVASQLAAFVVVFVLCFMALLPGTPFELMAGYWFGIKLGLLACLVAQPLAHSVTFLFARRVGLLRVGDELRRRYRAFVAVDLAIKEDPSAAWLTVFLICLAYLPAGPKVYALAAIPSVPFYVVPPCAFTACSVMSLANVWLGHSMKDFADIWDGRASYTPQEQRIQFCMLLVNVGALVGVTALLSWYGKRALSKLSAIPEDAEQGNYVRIEG